MKLEDKLKLIKPLFERDGYAVIKGVFDPIKVQELKREAYALLKGEGGQRVQMKNDRPALMFGMSDISSVFHRYNHSEEMKTIAKFFLGEKTRQVTDQIYFKEAGDSDSFAWHRDRGFRIPAKNFKNIESCYLQTGIMVDPMHEDNGAIEFIPGSHLNDDGDDLIPRDGSEKGLRGFIRGNRQGKKMIAEPGDVGIWGSLVIHGSEPNFSNQQRFYYMCGFASDDAILDKHSHREFT